jgi:hypothetical protein
MISVNSYSFNNSVNHDDPDRGSLNIKTDVLSEEFDSGVNARRLRYNSKTITTIKKTIQPRILNKFIDIDENLLPKLEYRV